jgi:membrane dipeptidase
VTLPALALLLALAQTPMPKTDLHHSILTVDTHCDTPMRFAEGFDPGVRHAPFSKDAGCQDLVRMKEGGLAASFFAVYVGQGPRTPEGEAHAKGEALATLDLLDRMYQAHPDLCERALRADDAARIFKTGKRAIFIGMENGYQMGHELSNLDLFYQRGVRYLTLVHSADNDLSGSATTTGPKTGLSELGKRVVARLNDLGMIIDISHMSEPGVADVLKLSRAPLMASHSGARALCNHPRNLTDEQLKAIGKAGGVVQVSFVPDFVRQSPPHPARDQARKDLEARVEAKGGWGALNATDRKALGAEWDSLRTRFPGPPVTVKDLVDHIDHIAKLIGVDHVGIGTDFDGGGALDDCSDVTQLPRITEELLRRGYKEPDLRKIWGGNALRVMRAVEQAKKKN